MEVILEVSREDKYGNSEEYDYKIDVEYNAIGGFIGESLESPAEYPEIELTSIENEAGEQIEITDEQAEFVIDKIYARLGF